MAARTGGVHAVVRRGAQHDDRPERARPRRRREPAARREARARAARSDDGVPPLQGAGDAALVGSRFRTASHLRHHGGRGARRGDPRYDRLGDRQPGARRLRRRAPVARPIAPRLQPAPELARPRRRRADPRGRRVHPLAPRRAVVVGAAPAQRRRSTPWAARWCSRPRTRCGGTRGSSGDGPRSERACPPHRRASSPVELAQRVDGALRDLLEGRVAVPE